MTTIGLVMVAKDEEATISRCLETVRDVVDHWTLVDTGSTDDTVGVASEALDGLPGIVHSVPWEGFARTRTRALELARPHTDYLLMLDADHSLHVEGTAPALDADAYALRIRGQLEWRLPLLTKASHPFEYRGAAHAYLASDVPARTEATDWLSIDGGPGASRDKLERDLVALAQAHSENPADSRTTFYLARTYDDLDNIDEAIRWYRKRIEMHGWPEEVYYSRYRLGCLLAEHVSFSLGADELLRAWRDHPHRAEALRALANSANAVAAKTPRPVDGLFVTPSAYRQEAA